MASTLVLPFHTTTLKASNAEAAYVAAQGLNTEKYGRQGSHLQAGEHKNSDTEVDPIYKLTDIQEEFSYEISYKETSEKDNQGKFQKDAYIINAFKYTSGTNGRSAIWVLNATTIGGEDVPAGNWYVVPEGKKATLTTGKTPTVAVE